MVVTVAIVDGGDVVIVVCPNDVITSASANSVGAGATVDSVTSVIDRDLWCPLSVGDISSSSGVDPKRWAAVDDVVTAGPGDGIVALSTDNRARLS